jgi:WD40 repeat protein
LLAASRQYFAAQADDRLLSDNQIELAGLVALNAATETARNPQGKLRQSLGAVAIAQRTGPLLVGTNGLTELIAIDPKGKFVAGVPTEPAGKLTQTIQLWETASGATIGSLAGLSGNITALAISPDGEQVAAGSTEGEVMVWNAQSRDLVATLNDHATRISALFFSRDGARLLSGSGDNTIQLWDVGRQKIIQRFMVPRFTADDRSCRTFGVPTRPRSSAETGRNLVAGFGSSEISGIVAVALNENGDRILAGTEDKRLVWWNVPSGSCFQKLDASRFKAVAFGGSPMRAVLANDTGTFVATIADSEDNFKYTPWLLQRAATFARSSMTAIESSLCL